MGQLVFQATLGGAVNLVGPNTASTFNLNVPAVASTIATLAAQTFAGTQTFTVDAVVNGLTVGKGASAVLQNTAVGISALAANTTGANNTAVGYLALQTVTTGPRNTAIGRNALNLVLSGSDNTAVGHASLENNTGGDNTAVGTASLQANTSGQFNVAIGRSALTANTVASNNTAVGYQAGYNIVTSAGNVCLGYQSAYSLSSSGVGNFVTTIGYQAFYYGLGDGNVAIGRNSQYGVSGSTNGSVNVSVGNNSLKSITSASGCVAIGNDALGLNTSGSYHVAVGYQALYNNTGAGQGSVGLGYYAGGTLTSGTNGVFLGYNAQPNAATDTNELVIGTPNTTGKGSNTGFIVAYNGSTYGGIYQGNNSASWSTTSDQRIKKNVVDVANGLSVITALRPVEFDYKENDKHEVGFIAQEFQQILPDQIIYHAPNEAEKEWVDDEVMGIQPNLVPYLVKAIQELKAEFDAYKASHP
jgi:hypothetical protein